MHPHRRPLLDPGRNRAYRMRGLAALALSVVLVLSAFRFWPLPDPAEAAERLRVTVPPQEQIEIELIDPTIQNQTPPTAPPPLPSEALLPPVEVPDETVIEEQLVDLPLDVPADDGVIDAPPAPPVPVGPPSPPEPSGPPPLVREPDRSPVPVRFSEPAYPPEARREGIRARVRIEVLVNEVGRVTEARIVERLLLGRGDREEPVASLPYGMDQAALDAAQRYQFRAARNDGARVRSYTTITCSFGV
ncbi:MAG: TonB family protein [Rhodothermaceae bacterium]|nr:TonB family protein [Rhodothermaceae bacterium]